MTDREYYVKSHWSALSSTGGRRRQETQSEDVLLTSLLVGVFRFVQLSFLL